MKTSMIILLTLMSCSTPKPHALGIKNGKLNPCPSSPNCVCSEYNHSIKHLTLSGESWKSLIETIKRMDRSELISLKNNYAHFAFKSRFLGFIDDLELLKRNKYVAIRSASRSGYYDFNVNYKRVEKIRLELKKLKAIIN